MSERVTTREAIASKKCMKFNAGGGGVLLSFRLEFPVVVLNPFFCTQTERNKDRQIHRVTCGGGSTT